MRSNYLWCIAERQTGSRVHVMAEEVFSNRADAREYLRSVKTQKLVSNPRSLFIRQVRVTSKRG